MESDKSEGKVEVSKDMWRERRDFNGNVERK